MLSWLCQYSPSLVSEYAPLANAGPLTKVLEVCLTRMTYFPRQGLCTCYSVWKISKNPHNLLSFLFQASAYGWNLSDYCVYNIGLLSFLTLPNSFTLLYISPACLSPSDMLCIYSHICSPPSPTRFIGSTSAETWCVLFTLPSIFNTAWHVFVEWIKGAGWAAETQLISSAAELLVINDPKRKEQVMKWCGILIHMLCKDVLVSTGYITRKGGDSHFVSQM